MPFRQTLTAVDAEDQALRAAERAARVTVHAARLRAREARKQLAADILATYRVAFGTLEEFTAVVAARLDRAPRTVQNALYETFAPDALMACVDVLAEARIRRAA